MAGPGFRQSPMVQLPSTRRRPSSPWRRCEALPSSPSRDVQAPKRGGKALVPAKVVVCVLVGFLGVLSATLGFTAEGTHVKEEFEEYTEKAKTLPDTTTNESKLCLYSLYKQATVGPVNTGSCCCSKAL